MSYTRALEVAQKVALAAGAILRREFGRPGGPRGGGGHAEADDEAEELIRRELRATFPGWGYRGEETRPDVAPSADGHVWLVDPNDGTSSYLRGQRGAAVSIALLRKGEPVLGVVYAHTAPDHDGDLIAWAEGCGGLKRRTGSVTRAVEHPGQGPEVVLLSDGAERRVRANLQWTAPARFLTMPSIAYRLALVAAGDAAATLSLHGPQDWDYAGGHALLRGAGLELIDESGRPVRYTERGESNVRYCFGGSTGEVRRLAGREWDGVRLGQPEVFSPLLIGEGGDGAKLDLVRPVAGQCVTDAGALSRAQGCLLGQLAGDALGSLVEFRSAAQIAREYPGGPRLLADGGTWGTIAGQPTDDSEMALALARSIVAAGRYDEELAARAYGAWLASGPFDVGSTTSRALAAIARRGRGDAGGESAAARARAAASRESQANGSLMRISPLAIYGADLDLDVLAGLARADATLTHPHPVCQDAAAVFVIAIAHAIRSGCSAARCHAHALEWASNAAGFAAPVRAAVERAAAEPPADYQSRQGWVLIALQNAFHELLHATSVEEAVVRTVRRGGDTDTNAAICGALLGALHGRDAIPLHWRQMVLSCRPLAGLDGVRHPRPRAFWPVDALVLAERLLGAVTAAT